MLWWSFLNCAFVPFQTSPGLVLCAVAKAAANSLILLLHTCTAARLLLNQKEQGHGTSVWQHHTGLFPLRYLFPFRSFHFHAARYNKHLPGPFARPKDCKPQQSFSVVWNRAPRGPCDQVLSSHIGSPLVRVPPLVIRISCGPQ